MNLQRRDLTEIVDKRYAACSRHWSGKSLQVGVGFTSLVRRFETVGVVESYRNSANFSRQLVAVTDVPARHLGSYCGPESSADYIAFTIIAH